MSAKSGINARRICMTLRLDRDVYLEIRDLAAEERCSRNHVIQRALMLYVTQKRLGERKK